MPDFCHLLSADFLKIEVTGMLARVRVEQRFSNQNGVWVEGV